MIDLIRDDAYNLSVSALALEIDQTLSQLDQARASMLESMVRDVLKRVRSTPSSTQMQNRRQEWVSKLDSLRSSVGTGKSGTTTEAIIEHIRSDRD